MATASAIAAFAFNLPVVFIETNIRRVFIHFFFPNQLAVSDKEIMPLITQSLDPDNSRDWYYALMDYGAMLAKLEINPNRRSLHYSKQSKFVGSNRQLRGKIIKNILENPSITIDDLAGILEEDVIGIQKPLEQLINEGFIIETEGLLSLS